MRVRTLGAISRQIYAQVKKGIAVERQRIKGKEQPYSVLANLLNRKLGKGLKPRCCLEGRQLYTTIQTTGAYDGGCTVNSGFLWEQ